MTHLQYGDADLHHPDGQHYSNVDGEWLTEDFRHRLGRHLAAHRGDALARTDSTARAERPPVDAFDDVIPATERGGYLVRSKSRPGAWWMVDVLPGRLVCHCEAAQARTLPDESSRC